MVVHIKRMAVGRHRWLEEDTFKDGVAVVQSIPGAIAMQMAAYVGLKTRGLKGAFLSYLGFVLPAFVLMTSLSYLYVEAHELPAFISIFDGLKVVVVAILASATVSFGRDTLKGPLIILIAAATAGLLLAGINPFFVVIGAAIAGAIVLRKKGTAENASGDHAGEAATRPPVKLLPLLTLPVAVAAIAATLFLADIDLLKLAAVMSSIDIFAFGGAFGAFTLMLNQVVDVQGWMDSSTFMDGIALGQVTPGPILTTATFIGYYTLGFPGAVAATIGIFTPSFVILALVTPFFDRFKASRYYYGLSRGILASFVGLLLYITVTFAIEVPWDAARVILGTAAFTALVLKVDIVYVVLAGSVVSLLLFR